MLLEPAEATKPRTTPLMPNVVRQRLEFALEFHAALSNWNRLLTLIAVLKHGDSGVRPKTIVRETNLAPDVVSKSLKTLSQVFLVQAPLERTDAPLFKPTKLALKWYEFENVGEPSQVLEWLQRPNAIDPDPASDPDTRHHEFSLVSFNLEDGESAARVPVLGRGVLSIGRGEQEFGKELFSSVNRRLDEIEIPGLWKTKRMTSLIPYSPPPSSSSCPSCVGTGHFYVTATNDGRISQVKKA